MERDFKKFNKNYSKIDPSKFLHKDLSLERWFKFAFVEQMANVGAEIGRTVKWKQTDIKHSNGAFARGMELLCLTIGDPKNKKHLNKLLEIKDGLIDHFVGSNKYETTDEQWDKYFYAFGYIAAINRGR